MGDGRYDQIYVSMEALEDAQNRLRKLCSYLSGQRNSISSIANGLTRSAGGNLNISLAIQSSGGRKSSVGDIKSVLRDLSAMLDACSYESNRIQSAVKNAADLFAENEKHLTTCVGAEAAPMPMQETGTEHDALWEKYTGSVAVKNTRLETDWRGE